MIDSPPQLIVIIVAAWSLAAMLVSAFVACAGDKARRRNREVKASQRRFNGSHPTVYDGELWRHQHASAVTEVRSGQLSGGGGAT
jgi:hypothetical protein